MTDNPQGNSSVRTPLSLDTASIVFANRNLLCTLPLFAGISFELLEAFFLKCEYRQLQPKDLILSPGQPNHHLYVLLAGQLTVHIENLDSRKGFQIAVGEFVGEVSIIDGQAPTALVAASEVSLLLCIHEDILWDELFLIPGVARNILRQIAQRMRARNSAIQKSVEQTIKLEHLEKELLIAQELQISMLPYKPFFPKHPQIEVDGLMKPAKEVGGDFFDVFPLDSNRICFAIGDVAGKGVPAALFMVRSLTVLRAEMLKTKDLLQTIHAINESLSDDNMTSMFLTMMICVVDTSNGLLQFVNGGHNRPLLGNMSDGFRFLLQPKGILVGINPKAVYQIATHQLIQGDMLILYTDGITEAINPTLEEFSEQRLLECINRLKEQSSSGMITGIKDAVFDFAAAAEQSDDLTLLILQYRG